MKSSGIGGQAVLEGVMMRSKSDYAVAVRKPDGAIAVMRGKTRSIADRSVFFRLPLIRGVVVFVESLVLGIKTIAYSSTFYEDEGAKEDAKQSKKDDIEVAAAMILSILLAVGAFIALPFFLSQLLRPVIESSAVLALIEGIIRVALFVGYILAISLMRDIKRVFMYHGAEHKAINCVENGLELTVGNARRQSRQHRRCGTSFIFIVMFVSIVAFMFIHFENVWLRVAVRILLVPVIAGVSYEFIRAVGNSDGKLAAILSKPGMLLQGLTTREPDDKMLEVAIAATEEVFDWREYQKRRKAAQTSREERERRDRQPKKSRAQMKEELRVRERENKMRATERVRQLKEMEKKEEELEKVASEARKRKEARQAISLQQDGEDDALSGLDHFFDGDDDSGDK